MADAPSDYEVSGYGIISAGSSMKLFMGTDQQFFLGGKNAMNIGTSNTFTAGLKADLMVGPAVSMSLGKQWDKNADLKARQIGHYFAKYDFSTNKNFAFQIAIEGSSNYVTQSKFICKTGFLAVGGFQKSGVKAWDLYTTAIENLGNVVLVMNLLTAAQQVAWSAAPSPEKDATGKYKDKGDLASNYTRQMFAKLSPVVLALTNSSIIGHYAIRAALQREGNFKSLLHPQSVIDLSNTSVFLGALGDVLEKNQGTGASLKLSGGTATLGVRDIRFSNPANNSLTTPYTDKFTDFNDPPTAALTIDKSTIKSAAFHMISIAAGAKQNFDPKKNAVEAAQKVLDELQTTSNKVAAAIYDKLMLLPGADPAKATVAKDASLKSAQPAIVAAQKAVEVAKTFYQANPSLYLSAGGDAPASLSKIEAEAPNFNVISPSISLSDTPIPLRGLFVKKVPLSIELVQSPVSKISMDPTGSIALTVNPTISMKLKPTGVDIKLGPNSISMKPVGVMSLQAGGAKIDLGMGMVKVGNSLKVMG